MRLDVIFIGAGVLALLVGESLGIWMGMSQNFMLSPAHAHLNLVGWVTLCLYGLAHRAYPALAASRLAPLQAWVAIPSAFLLPFGIGYAITTQNPLLALIGSVGVLAGTLLFAVMFMRKAQAA